MKAPLILSVLALTSVGLVSSSANAITTLSAEACHQVYQQDVSKIRYDSHGIYSDINSDVGIAIICPVARTPAGSGAAYQNYYVDGVNWVTSTTICTLTVLNYNQDVLYQLDQTIVPAVNVPWEVGWAVPVAQSPMWAYASIECNVPRNELGMIIGTTSD
jgi:hypothetical protein